MIVYPARKVKRKAKEEVNEDSRDRSINPRTKLFLEELIDLKSDFREKHDQKKMLDETRARYAQSVGTRSLASLSSTKSLSRSRAMDLKQSGDSVSSLASLSLSSGDEASNNGASVDTMSSMKSVFPKMKKTVKLPHLLLPDQVYEPVPVVFPHYEPLVIKVIKDNAIGKCEQEIQASLRQYQSFEQPSVISMAQQAAIAANISPRSEQKLTGKSRSTYKNIFAGYGIPKRQVYRNTEGEVRMGSPNSPRRIRITSYDSDEGTACGHSQDIDPGGMDVSSTIPQREESVSNPKTGTRRRSSESRVRIADVPSLQSEHMSEGRFQSALAAVDSDLKRQLIRKQVGSKRRKTPPRMHLDSLPE
jgi:hypothetical protein